jgi:hypothetical protein
MRSVGSEQSTGSHWNFAFEVAGAVVAFLLIASCGNTGASADSIAMDRDVAIEGLIGHATSLAPTPGGGFVVAGYSWAVATDANGAVLWRYTDPDAAAIPKSYGQSEFHGVVPLSNGNILLCGIDQTPNGSVGLLTVLNSAGQLVEKRLIQPPGPGTNYAVRFDRCLRWDDGIAVIGGTVRDGTRFDWLMKLDGNGGKQWDLFDYGLIGIDAVETVNHNLVMASTDVVTRSTRLVQVNPQGHVVSTMPFAGYPDNMVRSAVPTSTLKVLANIDRADTEVFTLNDKFAQIVSPRPTKLKMTINGCAWVLSDGSVAVFGNLFAQGGVYRSTVARIAAGDRPDEARAFALPNSQSISASVYDAVPISEKTFVAARDLNGSLVLSWVTFK